VVTEWRIVWRRRAVIARSIALLLLRNPTAAAATAPTIMARHRALARIIEVFLVVAAGMFCHRCRILRQDSRPAWKMVCASTAITRGRRGHSTARMHIRSSGPRITAFSGTLLHHHLFLLSMLYFLLGGASCSCARRMISMAVVVGEGQFWHRRERMSNAGTG